MTLHPCPFVGAIVFRYVFPWAKFDFVLKNWQKTAPFADERLSSELDLKSPKSEPETSIEFKGQFEGTLKQWRKMIKKEFPWLLGYEPVEVHYLSTFADCGRWWARTMQSYQKVQSLFYMKKMTQANRQVYKKALPRDSCSFTAMRGHVASKKMDATAFPWREALFWNLNNGSTFNPNDLVEHEKWVDDLYHKLEKNLIFLPHI